MSTKASRKKASTKAKADAADTAETQQEQEQPAAAVPPEPVKQNELDKSDHPKAPTGPVENKDGDT